MAILIVCLHNLRDIFYPNSLNKINHDNIDVYYCGISSHVSEFKSPMRENVSDSSFDTFIMDNSHDPKNNDGQASNVCSDVVNAVHVYAVLWCTSYILYIFIEHRMYLILIINQNLILCDHEN